MLLEFAKIRMFRYFCNRSKGLKMAYNLNLGGRLLSLSEPKVMGIVNLTPDSFFAQSRYQDTCQVVRKVASMLEDGMDILDLGAVSSRPGATFPSPEEEWQRLEKPLKALVREFPSLVISIDTFRSEIALRCADEGALVINDISAGAFDPGMFPAVARLQLPYVLMHMEKTPDCMQENPRYKDVVSDLIAYFSEKARAARMAGIHDIILDPGFGFAKTLEHNYRLLAHLQDFSVLGMPVLAGLSRKSMLYKLLGTTPQEALNATTAANMLALANGASILRVHDVKEAAECVRIYRQYRIGAANNPDAESRQPRITP